MSSEWTQQGVVLRGGLQELREEELLLQGIMDEEELQSPGKTQNSLGAGED